MPIQLFVNTRVRSTPFSSRVEANGVQAYTVYNHMLLPLMFESLVEDYRHLKEHVQLWDVACQRQVEVVGPDAARLVQLMTPRDVTTAAVGRCLYAPLVDAAGGVVNDPVISKLAEDRFWISVGDSDVVLWADGLATGLGLDVRVFEPDVHPLAVQGPHAEEVVARVFGDAIRDVKFFKFDWFDFQGHPLLIARTGWSKQGGFEVYLDAPELGEALWDALWDAGADLQIRAGCPNLIERIEGGLLSYGGDMTREHNPYECGFDAYCQLDHPIDFLGRAALERVAAEGPTRRVRGLLIDAEALPGCRRAWPVFVGDQQVGQVTSATMSPDRGCGVAIAMIDRTSWDTGTVVHVETPDGRFEATVTDLPIV